MTAAFQAAAGEIATSKDPSSDLNTPEGRKQYAEWAWEHKDLFDIAAPDGTSIEYIDKYMKWDSFLGRVDCGGPCTNIDNVNSWVMGGELPPGSSTIFVYRDAFTPFSNAVYRDPGTTAVTMLGRLNMSPAGAIIWTLGHEAAHSRGVDIHQAIYPHLEAEYYGHKAFRAYKAQAGGH